MLWSLILQWNMWSCLAKMNIKPPIIQSEMQKTKKMYKKKYYGRVE